MDQIDKDKIKKVLDDNDKYINSYSIGNYPQQEADQQPAVTRIQIDFNHDFTIDDEDYGLTELEIIVDDEGDGKFSVEFETWGSPGENAVEEYYKPDVDIILRMNLKTKKIIETANKFLGMNFKRLQGFEIPISIETLAEILTQIIKNSDSGWDDEIIELKTDPNVDLLLGGSYD